MSLRGTKLRLFGDVAIGAIGGAKNGAFGSLLLAAARNNMLAVGTLSMTAGACALGGALMIIPGMLAHDWLFDNKSDVSFLMQVANTGFRAGLAFVGGCAGAAILGMAIVPIGLTSLTASLTFSLLSVIVHMITEITAPTLRDRSDNLSSRIS